MKVFFLGISMLYSFSCPAQFIDDIPLFEESDSEVSSEKKTQDEVSKSASKPVQKPEPNLGRKAIPLNEIIVTPNPLPKIGFGLDNKKFGSEIPEKEATSSVPVNTREQGIYLPPADKTEAVPAQPSQHTNVHDVRQFDIEGFYLGMQPKAVLQTALQKGYKVAKTKKALPLFQTSYYETQCRQMGIHNPTDVRFCIRQFGQKNQQDYIEEIVLTKPITHESFYFKFTSPGTGNEAWKIVYANKGDHSLNFTPVNLSKKLNRKEAFFNAVFARYGYPDDSKQLVWGAETDAYMQVSMMGSAYDATITLVDRNLSDEDYFEAVNWKENQKTLYHFGFDE